ncbi:MAG TPA: hypothetical protein ENK28_02135 [Aliiroseovarius sp.]|nr:hypothetical protein [Aliiroseovarius sp.]
MSVLQADSSTAIVKRAFGWAEHSNDFDSLEDDTPEAIEGRLRYDARRRQVLEALDWNFARRRFAPVLRPDVVAPIDFPVAYARPPECLRVRALLDQSGHPLPFNVEYHIFTDCQVTSQIAYTKDIQNPAHFPPAFTQALEFLLAAEFAMIYARSVNRSNTMLENYRRTMIDADRIEGLERSDDEAYVPGPFEMAISNMSFGDRV